MGKIIILTESDLTRIVKMVINEQRISDLPQKNNQKEMEKWGDVYDRAHRPTKKQKEDWQKIHNELDHDMLTVLAIGTAFIPTIGPFVSMGISLFDAKKYYEQGDKKTAGLCAMFAFLPGVLSATNKLVLPSVKKLGENGMKTLANKIASNSKLTELESSAVNEIATNQKLIQEELSKIASTTANNLAQKAANQSVKKSLIAIGKKGLIFTGKNVAPYVGAYYGYNTIYDKMNPGEQIQTDLNTIFNTDVNDISDENKKAALEIQF